MAVENLNPNPNPSATPNPKAEGQYGHPAPSLAISSHPIFSHPIRGRQHGLETVKSAMEAVVRKKAGAASAHGDWATRSLTVIRMPHEVSTS